MSVGGRQLGTSWGLTRDPAKRLKGNRSRGKWAGGSNSFEKLRDCTTLDAHYSNVYWAVVSAMWAWHYHTLWTRIIISSITLLKLSHLPRCLLVFCVAQQLTIATPEGEPSAAGKCLITLQMWMQNRNLYYCSTEGETTYSSIWQTCYEMHKVWSWIHYPFLGSISFWSEKDRDKILLKRRISWELAT